MAECNAPFGEVIRGHFDIDLIADHDPDSEFAHFSRGVSQNLNPVFQFNAKHRIGKFFR